MTLQDLLAAVDDLSWDEIEQVQRHINERRRKQTASAVARGDLQTYIQQILADAKPTELTAGTMDIVQLEAAIAAMREGFTQAELNAIADAMETEYIEEDVSHDG